MADPTLAGARILICNDDGVASEGLQVLERVARALTDDVWVVAPETEQSAASHSLTIHRPLRLRQVGEKRFAVDGTPTDCALIGIRHVLRETPPDLVLSGINHGANLGEDVTYSGTIAAAIEATLLGVPAIALSMEMRADRPHAWATAERFGPDVVRMAYEASRGREVLVNVNFPARRPEEVTGISVAEQGRRPIPDNLDRRIDPRGKAYFWIGGREEDDEPAPEGTDVRVVADGGIALTPLHLDLTHRPSLDLLARAVAGRARA
jgi:5'-nucleotidase